MNPYTGKTATLLSVLLLFFCACAEQQINGAVNAPEAGPLMHAVYSDQLKSIMTRMEQLVYERELTALQIEEMRAESMENLTSTITELVLAARNMRETSPGTALSTEDRVIFEAMANQLLSTAEKLQSQSKLFDLTGMESSYRKLNETCDTCHRLFRL